MRPQLRSSSLACALALACLATSSLAANLTTTVTQPTGDNWNLAIWKTNGTGSTVAPMVGNTYELIYNGIPIGNATSNTRVRNPTTGTICTFPGDSLTLNTNTELRAKSAGMTLNFPGVGANPGLILNGGMLNGGDDTTFVITGKVKVASQSYLSQGANGGGGGVSPNRAFNFTGVLSGAGNLVILNAGTVIPQQISGPSNTFSGQWIVQCGWLLGAANNSLGTNSITVDPLYSGYLAAMPNASSPPGPAWFEVNYDLNSAGTLTLTNGGVMLLHQNCAFSAVRIEGTALSLGKHTYAELVTQFPYNFAASGSGSITVQPYGTPPPSPPSLLTQPSAVAAYVGTVTQLVATATGALPLAYQWQKGTNGVFVTLNDGGNISGTRTNTLSFSTLTLADAADYRLRVTNNYGAVTSQVATVAVSLPDTNGVRVTTLTPLAGATVNTLPQLQVTFSTNVQGVDAEDLQINGLPATGLSGSGSNYIFSFTQPSPGLVQVSWDPDHAITSLAGAPFNPAPPWTYTLADNIPPAILSTVPAPTATVSALTQAQVLFTEPVTRVAAAALLVNGQSATAVQGAGFGPYVFQFPQPAQGNVQFAWAPAHNIRDLAGNLLPTTGWTIRLDPPAAAAALTNLVINEFLASNVSTNGLRDEDLDLSDWIELYNRGASAINLAGWSLTTSPSQPAQWVFPATNLNAGQYLVLFASGKDRRRPGATLQTSFSLSSAGDYLGLYNADFTPQVAQEFAPQFPEQRADYSYGFDDTGALRYFAQPTPGGPNGLSTITGVVSSVHFSVRRGFFNQPFTLLLTVSSPAPLPSGPAPLIYYTTDGSPPSPDAAQLYSGPLAITTTTTLRAAAFAPDRLPSPIETHTYIFVADVLNQPPNPPGFPITTLWTSYGWPSDYGMDPNIVTDPLYADTITNDLLTLPVLSVVMRTDDMFGADHGLYTHLDGSDFEAPCSVELINPDGSHGFQCDAGIKLHGGGSRVRTMKHPMRLMFKGQYGASKLNYRFFPDGPVQEFDKLDLRSDYNNHWTHGGDATQRARGGLVRDAFAKDLHAKFGALSSHSRYVNLYINGLYWGIYNPCERPDASFAAAYLGGDKADYDAVNGTGPQLVDGDLNGRSALLSLNNSGLSSLAQYAQIQQYLDVPQYIDYMIVQLYGANLDWNTWKNWYAVYPHAASPQASLRPGFKYLCWDSERIFEGLNDNQLGISPDALQSNLARNPEYRLAFADHVRKHFFNGGALTPQAVTATWQARAVQIDRAMVGESARWGNSVPNGKTSLSPLPYPGYTVNTPYTHDENWLGEQQWILTNYLPYRSGIVLTQFMQAGLYPAVPAPTFNQHGGAVAPGFSLSMTPANATIYYTVNGSDPRVYGVGTPAPTALLYTNPVVLWSNQVVKARAWSAGVWSALNEAAFTVGGPGVPLCITEIMYNPIGGDAYEFIELQNLGATPIDLSGYTLEGVSYLFPNGVSLPGGAVLVLASAANPAAFATRYPGVMVSGYFGGALANSGERLALLNAQGSPVCSVDYKNSSGWPTAADGGGASLEIINPYGDPDDPANWRASLTLNGSPGVANPPAPLASPAPPRLNEIMAENAGAVTNGGTFPDWVELYNPGTNPVSLANWSLSNSGNPRKYVFPSGTTIPSQGYLVVWCDSQTTAPGLHSGFNLGRKGESLFLYDAATNRVDVFSFGLQLANYTVGRAGADASWQLCTPTPGSTNVTAAVASATNLVLNEWLANPAVGASDWLELYNLSSNQPVALAGLYLATSNDLFQIRSVSFLAPGSFIQLWADKNPGSDHLDFKLSASGDQLALYDPLGQLLDQVTFGPQLEGASQGRWPNGSATVVSFAGTASPGASNYVVSYSGPVLNELMARNESALYDSRGNTPDWIELYNPNTTNFSLAGMSLGTRPAVPGQWIFPPGASIPANGYLLLYGDSSRPASTNLEPELNTGLSLGADGDAVYLFNSYGQLVDSVVFGFQVADLSLGRQAGSWRLLSNPTPGTANAPAATLGAPANLRINEWMAEPLSGNDWFELYNTDSLPVSLSGLFLTDDPSLGGVTNTQIAPLSFIASHGWVKFEADAQPSQGPNHVNFSLDKNGETLRLYDTSQALIDVVDFGLQATGVSQGRLPDGGQSVVSFATTPTPAASNYLPLDNVVVNEVLSHTDPPLEDAIELYNPTAADVAIGGWFLSNSETDFKKYRIPDGTVLTRGGYRVFYEYQFNGTNAVPFTFNSARGDQVLLSQADAQGNFTGYRVQLAFGAAENGVSLGRFLTSLGADFVPMASRSFGVDSPATLAQFRTGSGLTNSYPKVGPIILNEIMYHPITISGTNTTENPDEEFVELVNITPNTVALYDPAAPTNHWKLSGAVEYLFPAGASLSAGAYAVVVGFDPITNLAALANFKAKYNLAGSVPLFGPYAGKLNNAGESVELYKPDPPQTAPHPDAGLPPYVLVDRVHYGPAAPWPAGADGSGQSLQRKAWNLYGNEPLNWLAGTPTPGSPNCLVDSDGDGLPDDWELASGLNPSSAVGIDGASGDPDGDGFTNLQEYLVGTNPRDPLSYLKLNSIVSVSGSISLRFTAVAGHSYTIQYRDNLTTGDWQKLADVEPTPTNSTPLIPDTSSPGHAARFYRLLAR